MHEKKMCERLRESWRTPLARLWWKETSRNFDFGILHAWAPMLESANSMPWREDLSTRTWLERRQCHLCWDSGRMSIWTCKVVLVKKMNNSRRSSPLLRHRSKTKQVDVWACKLLVWICLFYRLNSASWKKFPIQRSSKGNQLSSQLKHGIMLIIFTNPKCIKEIAYKYSYQTWFNVHVKALWGGPRLNHAHKTKNKNCVPPTTFDMFFAKPWSWGICWHWNFWVN